MNCTPNVRHCDIMFNTWGDFLCLKEYRTKNIQGNSNKRQQKRCAKRLSCNETARQFGTDDKRIASWERIYLEEGPEGLYIERRGRKSIGRLKNYQKLYLSPILDLYSGDIISYTIYEHPYLSMVTEMLDKAFEKNT